MLRRITPLITVAALATTGLAFQASTVPASGARQDKVTPTAFAMEASGYASRVKGGQVPAGSDRSAYQVVACTNEAGRHKTNSEAAVDLGTGMNLSSTKTRTWTTKVGNTVTSHSTNTVANLTFADTPLGSLSLKAIRAESAAWHNASGFHSKARSSLGKIVLNPTVGDRQTFPIPSPGQSTTIPGLAVIRLGAGTEKAGPHAAAANIDAVRVKLLFSDTVVYVAHSRATIQDGVVSALYGGSSYATKVDGLEGTVSSGRTPATLVPCVGTDGDRTKKAIAHANLEPGLTANGLRSDQLSGLTRQGRPEVTTRSHIAAIDLGNQLVIKGIDASAHVEKTAGGYQRSSKGTGVARIIFDGDVQQIPDTGVLEIPGVARIEPSIIHRTARGITVTALRVTLLDGRAAVVNLGYAKAFLQPSGM